LTLLKIMDLHLRMNAWNNWVFKELKKEDFSEESSKEIGRGSFGVVKSGTLTSTTIQVAIKHLYEFIPPQKFEAEMKLWPTLKHENIVKVLGFCKDPFVIVSELMECSLRQFLSNIKDKQKLNLFELCSISIQIQSGLKYLHSKNIIHRDLNSGNILIDKNVNVKITDFGQSKEYIPINKMTDVPGALAYLPPQGFTNDYTFALDVWSFGVLVVEMILKDFPTPDYVSSSVVLSKMEELISKLDDQLDVNESNRLKPILGKTLCEVLLRRECFLCQIGSDHPLYLVVKMCLSISEKNRNLSIVGSRLSSILKHQSSQKEIVLVSDNIHL